MNRATTVYLPGKRIQLETLTLQHEADLYAAAQHAEIWTYTISSAYGENFAKWWTKALNGLADGSMHPFVIRELASGRIVGSTRYYNISLENHSRRIGYSWLIPTVWGTGMNLEAKFLLLNYAFTQLRVNRIEIGVDQRNLRSQKAVEKLGLHKEGCLREDILLTNGNYRSTVIYSLLQSEWSTVKPALLTRLDASIEKQS